jgi:hypothetical protein
MKYKESNDQKRAATRKRDSDVDRKQNAWKKYEMNLRRAREGYSELELDEF